MRNVEKFKKKVEKLTNLKWMNLYNVIEPDKGVTGFQYAERKGVDSVAFIIFNEDTNKILLTKEYLPPVGHFLPRAFGGSLDRENANKEEIVKSEVLEEGGYDIAYDKIIPVGKSFVSSMMNQYCYLYLVLVKDENFVGRQPENAIEALAEVQEYTPNEVIELDDWKSITILSKANKIIEGKYNSIG